MKKILLLQMRPENQTCDSEFEAILRAGKIAREKVHRIRVEQLNDIDIDLHQYCAIIAGGSPFDVTCPEPNKSSAQKRVEAFFDHLFDQILAVDFPFLGICSGNGLLGNYFATPISGKYSEPISSVTVTLTEEGKKDTLLQGLPENFLAFVGHKEACDQVPLDATLLISSAACPVQMFRVQNNIYASQFHPEADSDEFILRIKTYKNHGYFQPEQAEELIAAVQHVETPVPKEILRRFVIKYGVG